MRNRGDGRDLELGLVEIVGKQVGQGLAAIILLLVVSEIFKGPANKTTKQRQEQRKEVGENPQCHERERKKEDVRILFSTETLLVFGSRAQGRLKFRNSEPEKTNK